MTQPEDDVPASPGLSSHPQHPQHPPIFFPDRPDIGHSTRRVVSVSLGSPSRDWQADLAELGVPLTIERRGVGRDYGQYVKTLAALDGDEQVAAIGLGGINRYLFSGQFRYGLRK